MPCAGGVLVGMKPLLKKYQNEGKKNNFDVKLWKKYFSTERKFVIFLKICV